MRRPVKPFVTEYRGGTRRQGAGGAAPKPDFSDFDMDQPTVEPRSGETRAEPRTAFSSRLAEPQEDSYEAAMRAADALFSARRPEPARHETSDVASAEAPHAGGRVLRVLDEAPSQEMLELEAERAPKRRGRKPGSKNKPKPVAPLVTQAAIEAWPIEAWPDEDDAAPTPSGVLPPMGIPPRIPGPLPAHIRAVALEAARTAVTGGVPRAGDKYAWVRTKLKPGQQWKRRLPKVAW